MGNVVHQYVYKEEEPFTCTHKNVTCKATPIFVEPKAIDAVQLAWQQKLDASYRLPKGWVYVVTADAQTCLIRHVKTGEMKRYYFLEDTRAFEKMIKNFEPFPEGELLEMSLDEHR